MDDVEIGDTFSRETPGQAWEVTQIYAARTKALLVSGQVSREVPISTLAHEAEGWRRCSAQAVL